MTTTERINNVDKLPIQKDCGLETVAKRPIICINNELRFGTSPERFANCLICPLDHNVAKPFELLPAQNNL